MKVQGQLKRRAHIVSPIRVDVGVGQRCRAFHIKSTTLPKKASARHVPSGRWSKGLGRFKMQALTRCDAEVVSTRTQQSVSSRASSRGRWRKCRRRFKMQTLTYCGPKITSTRTAVGQFKGQFSGAMEEMSQTVQNANTHKLRRQNHEHAHSSHSQFKDWFKGDGVKVWEGSKCKHSRAAMPKS